MKTFLTLIVIAGFAGIIAAGCSSDSPTEASAFEAKGLVLQVGTADTVVDSSSVHGSISVIENDVTGAINLLFIGKNDNKRSVPSGSGYTLGWSIADTSIASIESISTWSFKVHGKKAGTTTATLKLMNGTATIFTSSAITITVTPTVVGMHMGDSATFSFIDRDTNNQKIPATEKKKVWTVLAENVSIYGKTGVTEMEEITYDITGAAELERDTLYMQFASDGSIYEYDLLRRLLLRVSGGDAFSSELPAYWVKVTNTTATSAASWMSAGVDSILVPNVTAPGIPTSLNVIFKMMAQHHGTQAATVPAGTYPSAVRTSHTLFLNVEIASLGVSALNDSLHFDVDASVNNGVLREVFEGKIITARAFTVNDPLPVNGFEMELKSIVRKK